LWASHHRPASAQEQRPAQQPVTRLRQQNIRVESYRIDVAFEPEKFHLKATTEVTLRAGELTQAIEFELNPRLAISEITDSLGRTLRFERSARMGSSRLVVWLAEPCGAEQGVTLTFRYAGALPPRPLDYITKDGILLRDESRWYPATDLAAFAHHLINMNLPTGWNAVGAGFSSIEESRYQTRVTRKTTRPVSSRSIAAFPTSYSCGPFLGGSGRISPSPPLRFDVSGCVPLEGRAKEFAIDIDISSLLVRYSGLLGKYPSSGLAFVQGFPGQRGSIGYSAPGFLVVGEDVVKYHAYPGYAPEFLPHEIAHQWFPIEVTLAQPEDGWLAESVAEYLAWRYLLEKQPADAQRMVARAMRGVLVHEPLRPLGRGLQLFAEEDWDVTHATLYERGLLVFRTLETVIGRSRVDAALQEYYKRFAGRSASIADFRKLCQEISGRELGWFFDYFLAGTQLPEIALRRLPGAAPGEFAGEIVIRNVPSDFQVRVEMRLHTPRGVVDHSVATRGEVTPFTVSVPDAVTHVTLDPDARILRLTEAALRHKRQMALLEQAGELERSGQLAEALRLTTEALAADADNLAANHQLIHFQVGRLNLRFGRRDAAWQAFEQALARSSLDVMAGDFYAAWARVYRARVAHARGRPAEARREAQAGLALNSPALETRVAWPEAPQRETSARAELQRLASQPQKMGKGK
jgi:tetratricopeptide (TPR) repeat protein